MTQDFPWGILGIAPTKDRKAIRSAYSAKLKSLDIDKDVQGYEDLRAARSEALYLATQDDAGTQEEAPQFTAPGTAQAELEPIDASETKQDAGAFGDQPLDPDQPPPSAAPVDLLAILYPDREPSQEPLTYEEYEAARDAMQRVIGEARSARVDMQTGIEHWLAHYLAGAWPRSGQLVEEASKAFSWDKDAGRIDEDPAVAFLNGRLELEQRTSELELPSHRYHDAWQELKKPGARGRFAFGGPKREKVISLLNAVRNEYPELEAQLDADRVASYTNGEAKGLPGWAIGLLVLGLLMSIGRFASSVDPAPSLSDLDRNEPGSLNWSTEDQQRVVDTVLGPGVPLDEFTQELEGTAMIMAVATRGSMPTEAGFEMAEAGVRNSLRGAVADAAALASFEELLLIKSLKRDLLVLAREEGGSEACNWALRTGNLSENLDIPADFKAKETGVFRALYDAGKLGQNTGTAPTSASVPGDVIEQVMARLGRPVEEWDSIASVAEPSRTRCDFEIALLDVVLQRPGTVSAELLRMI